MTAQPADATTFPLWCIRLTSELDAADARAIALTNGLGIAQLNWKSRPDTWSVGQCLEHLSLTNEIYIGPIAEALGGRPTGSVDEITPGWFGRWFIREYIEPRTQRRRGRAPTTVVPIATQVDASIVSRFIASNAMVREVIARAHGYDINRLRFRNPFVPLLRFTVGTGLQIIVRHNHRHLDQAERVTRSPDFPRA